MKKLVLALFVALAYAAPANAAFINIDDSDLARITLTAGDFEEGFFVDGNLLTIGLFNSASITFDDAAHTISGSWIDLGAADGARVDLNFAMPSDLSLVTSGIEFGATSTGSVGTLNGSYGGFRQPGIPYFATGLPTLVQNGQTGISGVAFLSVSFVSENATVPEPATLLLVAPALALARRRRRS